jgi:hypothetical protein
MRLLLHILVLISPAEDMLALCWYAWFLSQNTYATTDGWTWKDSDDGVCCTELLGLFWTLSIVWYVEDKNYNVSETGSVSVLKSSTGPVIEASSF